MSQDDVIQIKVNQLSIGIIGLKTVMEEMAADYAHRPDKEVEAELLKRLLKKNYISDHARESYARAFLREFRKFLGQPYEEESSSGTAIQIRVLGPGCAQCDRLTRDVMDAMAQLELVADMEHVKDIKEIGQFGVIGTPALVINGKVKSVGNVPPKNKIMTWLKEVQK